MKLVKTSLVVLALLVASAKLFAAPLQGVISELDIKKKQFTVDNKEYKLNRKTQVVVANHSEQTLKIDNLAEGMLVEIELRKGNKKQVKTLTVYPQ